MASAHGEALAATLHDLQHIFGDRLQAFVAYGHGTAANSLALVQTITSEDLDACAARAAAWERAGGATPLLVTRDEFARSLDAFPIEYGEILDTHHVLYGVDPFADLSIRADDLRRACEVQVKSHLLHLRENYIECGGRHSAITALIGESAPAFAVLLRRLSRLDGRAVTTTPELGAYICSRAGLDPRVVGDVLALSEGHAAGIDGVRLFPPYLDAVERLARFVDTWKTA